MNPIPRRHWLLGTAALPAALMLTGCTEGGLPFLGGSRAPGSCLDASQELPEEVLDTVPEGVVLSPVSPDPDTWFSSSGFALSPDGSMLAACEASDRFLLELADSFGIVLWDTASGEVIRRITPATMGVIAWHPDGTRLAMGEGRHIAIIDLEGNLEWNLIGHELPESGTASIRDLTYSPDGSQLASSSSDGTVRLWDVEGDSCGEGHVLETGPRSNAALSYSPDGTTLAVGGTASSSVSDPENPLELWDPATGEHRSVLEDPAGIVWGLEHGADGSLLVVTDEPAALTVIAPDGTTQAGPVTGTIWFPSLAVGTGRRIALLGGDDELLIWDRGTGEETRLEAAPDLSRLCWSLDESELYSLSTGTGVRVWDETGWRTFDLP